MSDTLRLAEQLHPGLQAVLDSELAAGNIINEVSQGWPDQKSVFVGLKYAFLLEHRVPSGVVYRVVNDPHWWNSEYVTEHPTHILACGFLKKGRCEDRVRDSEG